MNTKLKKTTLLSALGICIFSGILYIHSSTSQNNTEKKSSLIKTKGTDQETRKEYYTSTENNIMEDQPRGVFEEGELSEIITNDGTYQETPKESYTNTVNAKSFPKSSVFEDQPRGIFEEEELSEIITNDGIYEEDTSIVN